MGVDFIRKSIFLEQAFKFEKERNLIDPHIQITPVPFAVFPLMKKPKELQIIGRKIYEDLIANLLHNKTTFEDITEI